MTKNYIYITILLITLFACSSMEEDLSAPEVHRTCGKQHLQEMENTLEGRRHTYSRTKGISKEHMQLVFQCNKGKISKLYYDALLKNSDLKGEITFSITIAPDGKVLKVVVEKSSLDDIQFVQSMTKSISNYEFINKDNVEQTISYPMSFLPR